MYASSDMHACMNNAAVCAFVTSPKKKCCGSIRIVLQCIRVWGGAGGAWHWRELKDVLRGQNCGPIT